MALNVDMPERPRFSTSLQRRNRAISRYLAATSSATSERLAATDGGHGFRLSRLPRLTTASELGFSTFPDLLHAVPSVALEHRSLSRALEFAFASGDAAGAAQGALHVAALAQSDFIAEAFASNLFVEELVQKVFRFPVQGRQAPIHREFLQRLLTHPPADPAHLSFRQEIQRELERSPSHLTALERTYEHIMELTRLFEESSEYRRLDMPRFRLDLLQQIRGALLSMRDGFPDAQSGLRRLHVFAAEACASEGFEHLCALLNFEEDMAQVDLHLRIGADGRIRSLQLMRTKEGGTKPFYQPPLMRALTRLWMRVRGYRLGEAELVERWFDHVYSGVAHVLPSLLQVRGDLEFYLACQHFRRHASAIGLPVSLPRLRERSDDGPRRVQGLFNPLLLGGVRPPTPCDLEMRPERPMHIVTGPNSGGKTRLLQAIGLTQLLAQSGAYVPAHSAEVRRTSGLFVSLGEEATADQQEGRLGSELLRIRRLFEQAEPGSLVILDELCSGTNPSEGEEIFHLVIELLRHLEPDVFITTHFLKFAAQLSAEADSLGLAFLQVELDDSERPTYQFVTGVATTSLARRTAERLGVTHEQLLSLVHDKRRARRVGEGADGA